MKCQQLKHSAVSKVRGGCLFFTGAGGGVGTRPRSWSRSSSYSRTCNSRYRGRHRSHSPFSDRKRDQGNRVSVVDLHIAGVQCKLLWLGLGYAIDCPCQLTIPYNYHRI